MPPRDYALVMLDGRPLAGWPAGCVRVRRGDAAAPADARDRGLAEQIIIGVVKNLLRLQHEIEHYARRSLAEIEPAAQKILAIGLYQIGFLDRVPQSAAVNEAVEQAKRFGLRRASGFINAVLRKATREAPPAWPSREESPAAYAEVVLSHPRELYARFEGLMGTRDALRLCEHDNREAPVIVRLCDGATIGDLKGEGVTARAHEQAGMLVVEGARPSHLGRWAREGIAQVQDPTSASVVPMLDIQPGQVVMDRCCGLGTKTLQMRERVGDGGRIIAVDPSMERMRILRESLEGRNISNVEVRQVGMLSELTPDDPREFDRILIDAPCSNSGVLARRAEARYAQADANLRSLRQLQDRILDDTAPALKREGKLLYSTCSIWAEENEERIAAFLRRHPEYRLERQQTTMPSLDAEPARYRDGGYLAVMIRASPK